MLLTGDSWVVDYGGYYAGWYRAGRPELAIVNRAQGGRGLDGLVADEAAVVAQRPYIYHAGIGRNDLPRDDDAAAAAWFDSNGPRDDDDDDDGEPYNDCEVGKPMPPFEPASKLAALIALIRAAAVAACCCCCC